MIEKALARLKGHGQCEKATFLHSRDAFRVTRRNAATHRQFAVRTLARKRTQALMTGDWEPVRAAFHQCVDLALEYLESGE